MGPVRQEGDRSCPQPVGDSGCPFGENPHGGEGISQRQICDPIVFDFGGLGIDLTDADDGVAFDIDADGAADQVAWTSARSRDAFLTLDRNGNGAVDDGGELFGNATRLVDGTFASDGYVVLAELDQPENGGNGNGFIDRADRIYAELRLWTDSNHDGVSAPSELTSLETRAVVAIRTAARRSAATDEHGNRFALVSVAYVKTFGVVRPILTTDVFLVEAD